MIKIRFSTFTKAFKAAFGINNGKSLQITNDGVDWFLTDWQGLATVSYRGIHLYIEVHSEYQPEWATLENRQTKQAPIIRRR